MKPDEKKYDTFLSSIQSVSGVEGALILNNQQKSIIHNFDDSTKADAVHQVTRNTVRLMNQLTRQARVGLFQTICLKGLNGTMYIIASTSHENYTIILGSDSMNLGLIRALYAQAIHPLNRMTVH